MPDPICALSKHLIKIRGFPTRMVYLCNISCLRYTFLVGNPRNMNQSISLYISSEPQLVDQCLPSLSTCQPVMAGIGGGEQGTCLPTCCIPLDSRNTSTCWSRIWAHSRYVLHTHQAFKWLKAISTTGKPAVTIL